MHFFCNIVHSMSVAWTQINLLWTSFSLCPRRKETRFRENVGDAVAESGNYGTASRHKFWDYKRALGKRWTDWLCSLARSRGRFLEDKFIFRLITSSRSSALAVNVPARLPLMKLLHENKYCTKAQCKWWQFIGVGGKLINLRPVIVYPCQFFPLTCCSCFQMWSINFECFFLLSWSLERRTTC